METVEKITSKLTKVSDYTGEAYYIDYYYNDILRLRRVKCFSYLSYMEGPSYLYFSGEKGEGRVYYITESEFNKMLKDYKN